MPKAGDRNEKGLTWCDGAWRSAASIQKKKESHRLYSKNRYEKNKEEIAAKKKVHYLANKERYDAKKREYYEANKERLNKNRSEYAKTHKEETRTRMREWYRRNRDEQNIREYARRDRRDPSRGVRNALSQYRRGEITFNELTRYCDDAIKRTDELCKPVRSGDGGTLTDSQRPGECSQGNSGSDKSES